MTIAAKFTLQIASDVTRDGLGVELLDANGDVLAEVFRSDRDKSVILTTFNNDIALDVMQELIRVAFKELEPFEDGTPLSSAANFGSLGLGARPGV